MMQELTSIFSNPEFAGILVFAGVFHAKAAQALRVNAYTNLRSPWVFSGSSWRPIPFMAGPILYSDTTFRLLADQVLDYAIFLLTPEGNVASWSPAAERIKGWKASEIIGQHFRNFYPAREQASHKPEYELEVAAATGRFEDEGWRVRKDGSMFWANVIITAIRGPDGQLLGFGKVTRDLTERKKAEERLRELSGRLLKIQDDERSRLGRELHDSIGQYLVFVKMALDSLDSVDGTLSDPKIRKQLTDCISTVDRSIQEVRTLSYLLYPPMLEETGLSAAIRWHLDGFSKRSGIQTTYDIDDSVRLPKDMELALFRAFQEGLTNVHRHSQSKSAHIRFTVENGEALLEVADQGKGLPANFSQDERASGSVTMLGVGLRGMRERIRQFRGNLDISSNSHGTKVRVTIPLTPAAGAEENFLVHS